MALHTVFYEFEINKKSVGGIVEDTRGGSGNNKQSLDFITSAILKPLSIDSYSILNPDNDSRITLKFSKKLYSEMLPHKIEGVMIFTHSGTEGQLALGKFKKYFEASLTRHGVSYKKYDPKIV